MTVCGNSREHANDVVWHRGGAAEGVYVGMRRQGGNAATGGLS